MDKTIFEEMQDKYYGLHAPIYRTLCKPTGGGQNDDNLEDVYQNIDLMEQKTYNDWVHEDWLKNHPEFKLDEDLKATYRNQRICLLAGIFLAGDSKQKKWVWEMYYKESVGFIKKELKHLDMKELPFYDDILQSVYCYLYTEIDKYNPYHKKASYFQWLRLQVTHAATRAYSELTHGQTIHYSNLMQSVKKKIAKLRQRGYDEPTSAQIATAMGPQVSTAQVEVVLQLIAYYDGAIPYDKYVNEIDSEQYYGEYTPENVVEKNERDERLYMAMDELTEEEREVIFLKYGLSDVDITKNSGTAADTEIAKITGMTTARVKELHRKAIKKLKRNKILNSLFNYDEDNKTEKITHSDLYKSFMDELNMDDYLNIIEGRKRDE